LGGAPIGGVAVVGPTRMRYPKVVSVVDYVADSVSEAVRKF
jgi:transcriptional regulator of heat shock response